MNYSFKKIDYLTFYITIYKLVMLVKFNYKNKVRGRLNMPKQFSKLKLKKLIAVGLSTAIVTTSTPLDIINAQMNNTNKEN